MQIEHIPRLITQPQVNLKILQYVTSAISYLVTHQHGTFNCVFVELLPSNPYNNFIEQLLWSAPLEQIPRFILTDSFIYSHEIHPNKPSLLVIHIGNRNIVGNLSLQLLRSLSVWDPSSRVLVLVEADDRNWRSVQIFMALLYKLKYHIVTTIRISHLRMLRYDALAYMVESWDHFVEPDKLFLDAMRNMKGKEIRYNVRFTGLRAINFQAGLIGPDIQWLRSTAKHLNATLRYLQSPCHSLEVIGDGCYEKFLLDNQVSIVLDHFKFKKLTPDHYRTLFCVETVSETIMVPNGRPLNIVELFLQPFTIGAWIILFVVLGVMEIVKQLLPKQFTNDPILLSICGIERYNLHVAGQWEKISYISLIIMFFLMTSAYEAKIIALMTERPSTQVISTFDDLIKSGIPVKIDLHLHMGFVNNNFIGKQVVNGSMDFDGVSAYYSQVSVIQLILTWPVNYDLALKRKRYVSLSETLRMIVSNYITELRSPLMSWLYWTQRVFFESGLTSKLQEITINELHKPVRSFWHQKGYEAFGDYDLIKFADFAPAWIALGVGLFACGCVFLWELLRKKQGRISTTWWI
uniref:ionotropic receptor 128 n=1 Tax=Aedes aegypti TaxID=7159 RepID=UPI000C21008C|nr:ionotropic receptor 128 [Aedes aegypti]